MYHWSKTRIGKLEKLYSHTADEEIARVLGATERDICYKANQLGLVKAEITDWGEEEAEDVSHTWSDEEMKTLEQWYPQAANASLELLLKKPRFEIEHFAYRLGLRKTQMYVQKFVHNTQEELALVKEWEKEYSKERYGNSRGNYLLDRILSYLLPHHRRKPEEPIGGLRIDCYLPDLKLAIEYHGVQHHENNDFHFQSTYDFYRAQNRDYEKSALCEQAGIALIVFYYNEDLTIGLVRQRISEVL